MQVTCSECNEQFEMNASDVAEAEVNEEPILCDDCQYESELEDEDDDVEELIVDDEA